MLSGGKETGEKYICKFSI